MASIKIILWKHDKKKDGTLPLALRITKDRKTRYIFTGEYIREKDWNASECRVKKSHPNSARLNHFLLKKLQEAHDTVLEAKTHDAPLSTGQIKAKVKRKGNQVSFFDAARERIADKEKSGVFSVSGAEKSIMNNIRRFAGRDNLSFQEITTDFIHKFKVYCTAELGLKTRTTTNQLIFIRTLFNKAIKDGVVDARYYPFAGDKEKIRLTSGLKIGLSMEEIRQIQELPLERESTTWHTRNVWLFAFYFAGIRISDLLELKWGDFKNGRLFYVMHKNEKPVSLKIPDKAKVILSAYKEKEHSKEDYVFPFLRKADDHDARDVFVKKRNAARLLNKHLKKIATLCGIDKNLSNHIARHSFGNIAGDAIHPLMLQKLYRHSDLKTTINYQANFIHKDADDALDAVLGS